MYSCDEYDDAGTRGRGDAGTRGRGDAGTKGRGDRYKIIKGTWVLSVWEWQQLMSTPKKYQFKHKKLKNPKNKNSFIDMLQRLKSDH